MAERARSCRAIHIDFGTGDGAFARFVAAHNPDLLVIGVDATAEGLRTVARRAAGKPSRGGLPNALFGRLSLEDAPGELVGLADNLTVLLPWGSLLRAVARAEPGGLGALRALCKMGADLRVVFGYGLARDRAVMEQLGLSPLAEDGGAPWPLERRYREAGFSITARYPQLEELRALPTTWAKRLAFSSSERRFIELSGRAV